EHGLADVGATPASAPPERPTPPGGMQVASSDYGALPDPAPVPSSGAVVPAKGGATENKIAPVGAKMATDGWGPGRRRAPDRETTTIATKVRPVGPVEPMARASAHGDEEESSAKNANRRDPILVSALQAYLDKRPDDALSVLKQY